ncbi:hypothetical protein ECZU28_25710 [Escherichia coli]|nr:hypothetical protein ECZU28_25710 [Escherichia coli]
MINVQNVSKTFILHQQNGVRLPVLNRASLTVNAGECVVLHGHPAAAINPAALAVRQLSAR